MLLQKDLFSNSHSRGPLRIRCFFLLFLLFLLSSAFVVCSNCWMYVVVVIIFVQFILKFSLFRFYSSHNEFAPILWVRMLLSTIPSECLCVRAVFHLIPLLGMYNRWTRLLFRLVHILAIFDLETRNVCVARKTVKC